jgi:hypothetical protein
MNTEYEIGNIRLRFESRASRRWLVALFYALLAAFDFAGFSASAKNAAGGWIVAGCLILVTGLAIVFSWIAGDMRASGDEREMHRRDHAHYVAYRYLFYCVIAIFFASYFAGPNPVTPHLPAALRELLMALPHFLIVATVVLYFSLPQAFLLWTEPDIEEAK